MGYKIAYNPRGKWYPRTNVITRTFKTKEAAMVARRNLLQKTNDPDIKKSVILKTKIRKVRRVSQLGRFRF